MPLKILILGANGFIGSSLTHAILKQKDWEVYGMDVGDHKLNHCLGHARFKFVEGDVTISREWIEYHVKKCDVVIPLVAIANPAQYVKDPLRVFELDFEANLETVRKCVKYGKRIVFPSTSEVYGMCPEAELSEESSTMVYGPIEKQRWIYACSKQLLDRVIYAYGVRDGVDYTLFRPFNWIGPKLDNVFEPKEGSSRLFTQFISNVIFQKPIQLVDGGKQSRSFHLHRRRRRCAPPHHREQEWVRLPPHLQHRQPRQQRERRPARPPHRGRVPALPRLPRARGPRPHGGRALGAVFRQVLPGHPQSRALDRQRPQAPRMEAEGRPPDGDPADARLPPRAQGLRARVGRCHACSPGAQG
jgi:nucleoside-diphosphate-sugar epimerase